MKERFYIGSQGISTVNLQVASDLIEEEIQKEGAKYICLANARAAYYAINNDDYSDV